MNYSVGAVLQHTQHQEPKGGAAGRRWSTATAQTRRYYTDSMSGSGPSNTAPRGVTLPRGRRTPRHGVLLPEWLCGIASSAPLQTWLLHGGF